MKGIGYAKLMLLQPPPLYKQGGGATIPTATAAASIPGTHHRIYLLALLSFFFLVSLIALLSRPTFYSFSAAPAQSFTAVPPLAPALPSDVFDALLHYALASDPSTRMPDADLRAVAAVLRRRAPCNLLVFGLGPETLLWRALNHGGRTVFVDENEFYAQHFEEHYPGIEAYGVSYTTKVGELAELLAAAREQAGGECRPVQNLLFSECRLGINDMPNQLYEVGWDVVLVDGPRGHRQEAPGRMASIFSSAVMVRSRGAGRAEVLVHDYDREAERRSSKEFLCEENLVGSTDQLAHFIIQRSSAAADGFCGSRTATSSSSPAAEEPVSLEGKGNEG